jgi:DHA2 family multidrug resistance protein
MLFVSESKKQRVEFDWTGFVVLSLFLGAFQLVLDRGSSQDWFDSTEIMIETAVAIVGVYMFAVHSLTTTTGFIDFGTLKDRNFAVGTASVFIFSMLFISTVVLIPSFLQTVVGDPVGLSGTLMTPRSLGIATVVVIAGRLSSRIDPRVLGVCGVLIVAYTMYNVSTWTVDVSSLEVAANGFYQGVGTGLAFVTTQALTFAQIPPARRNGAMTIFCIARNFGQTIGVSAMTTLLVRNTQVNHAEIAAHVTPFNRALQSGAAEHFWNLGHLTGRAALDAVINRQAAAIAYYDDFRLLMYVALAAIPLVFMLRPFQRYQIDRAPAEPQAESVF